MRPQFSTTCQCRRRERISLTHCANSGKDFDNEYKEEEDIKRKMFKNLLRSSTDSFTLSRSSATPNYSYPNLHAEDEDDEDAVSCEQDSRLLDGAAVSEEAEYEDEGTECDQDVGGIVNMNRRNKRLQSELV